MNFLVKKRTIDFYINEYGIKVFFLTGQEVRPTGQEVRSTAFHVRKQDSPLMKAKNERKRKFNSKIESVPQSEQTFKSTWNILSHVPDKLMPKFAETVNFVWKYLKCRRSEKFSPDLLWRIAYPFVSDGSGTVGSGSQKSRRKANRNAAGKTDCHNRL